MKFEYRRKLLTDNIRNDYPYLLHAIIPSSIAVIFIICSIYFMEHFSFVALLPTLLGLLVFEWFAHKYIMHNVFKYAKSLYQQHATHHLVYVEHDMAIRDFKEIKIVMIPPLSAIIGLSIIAGLISGLWLLIGQSAFTVLLTISVFYLVYEWLHFLYHAPNRWKITNLNIVKHLREHHLAHHETKLMRKYNFNVTFPVIDYLFKTKAKKEYII